MIRDFIDAFYITFSVIGVFAGVATAMLLIISSVALVMTGFAAIFNKMIDRSSTK